MNVVIKKIKSVLVVGLSSQQILGKSTNKLLIYVTGPMKIDHVSANYTELYFH